MQSIMLMLKTINKWNKDLVKHITARKGMVDIVVIKRLHHNIKTIKFGMIHQQKAQTQMIQQD